MAKKRKKSKTKAKKMKRAAPASKKKKKKVSEEEGRGQEAGGEENSQEGREEEGQEARRRRASRCRRRGARTGGSEARAGADARHGSTIHAARAAKPRSQHADDRPLAALAAGGFCLGGWEPAGYGAPCQDRRGAARSGLAGPDCIGMPTPIA